MVEIEYTGYKFTRPRPIHKFEFENLKTKLRSNPNYKFYGKSKYPVEVKFAIILIIISATGFLILSFQFKFPNWLDMLIGIPAIISLFIFLLAPGRTFQSFISFNMERNEYYSKLKNDLIKSKRFNDFKNLRKNEYYI
jgi:hypothetical protein